MPLDLQAPSSPKEVKHQAALNQPYGFADAMAYPFRGMGLYVSIGTPFVLMFVEFIGNFGIGCLWFPVLLLFWSMLVGLQFKIVRSTADGDNELPDWPEFTDFGERAMDLLAYLIIALITVGPVGIYLAIFGFRHLLTMEPSLLFWIGFVCCLWAGTALGTMAYGSGGIYDRVDVLRLPHHFLAFREMGAEAVRVTNVIFGLQTATLVVRAVLKGMSPLLGSAVSGVIFLYWFLVSPHLMGLLFRRNRQIVERIYG
ncbi:MAG: hypothetical protein KDD47_13345 [Acidobacteria bacterium]|nr:hypothetical protein [Acidobacteriota bacterium]